MSDIADKRLSGLPPAVGRKGMHWYVAELIVCCRVGKSTKGKSLFDRQVKVLRASTHEIAYQRALELGKEENHSYGAARDREQARQWLTAAARQGNASAAQLLKNASLTQAP